MTARKPKRTTVDAIVYRYMAEDYDDGEEMAKEVTIDRVRSRLAAVIDHVAGLLAALDNPTASTSAATLQGATEIEGSHEFAGLMYDVRDIGAALEFLPRGVAGVTAHFRAENRRRRDDERSRVEASEAKRHELMARAVGDPVGWLWRDHEKLLSNFFTADYDHAALRALTDTHRAELGARYRALIDGQRAAGARVGAEVSQ
jgi:hypothetical protein